MSMLEDALNSNSLFISVIGPHAGESVSQILERKQNDIAKADESFWIAKVAKKDMERSKTENPAYVLLVESSSKGRGAGATKKTVKATEFSKDGINWRRINKSISDVTGNINSGTTAYRFDKCEILDSDQTINLKDYETINGNAIRFNSFNSNILSKPAKNRHQDGMKDSNRRIVAVLRLKDENVVKVR